MGVSGIFLLGQKFEAEDGEQGEGSWEGAVSSSPPALGKRCTCGVNQSIRNCLCGRAT